MNKKEYCCDMKFKSSLKECIKCKNYYDTFDFCFLWGKVKNNDTEIYKELSNIILKLAYDIKQKRFIAIGWHIKQDEMMMKAVFNDYKRLRMCKNWEEHSEMWKYEDYRPDVTFTVPEELIIPLPEREIYL